jgi:long-subunit acyl-CoA synthetase (AMP-forming)
VHRLRASVKMAGNPAAVQGEWLVTGDRGRQEAGRIVVEGRRNRMWIDPQGQAISAFFVERALRAVSIVADAAVTSAPSGTMQTLIALDTDAALFLARRHGLASNRPDELLTDAAFLALATSAIRSQCSSVTPNHTGSFRFSFDVANT